MTDRNDGPATLDGDPADASDRVGGDLGGGSTWPSTADWADMVVKIPPISADSSDKDSADKKADDKSDGDDTRAGRPSGPLLPAPPRRRPVGTTSIGTSTGAGAASALTRIRKPAPAPSPTVPKPVLPPLASSPGSTSGSSSSPTSAPPSPISSPASLFSSSSSAPMPSPSVPVPSASLFASKHSDQSPIAVPDFSPAPALPKLRPAGRKSTSASDREEIPPVPDSVFVDAVRKSPAEDLAALAPRPAEVSMKEPDFFPEPETVSGQTPAITVTAGKAKPSSKRHRRARLRISRIDPWTVMKTTFMFSIAGGIIMWVAVYILWSVLATSGLFDTINQFVRDVLSNPTDPTTIQIEDYVSTNKVLGVTALLAAVNVVIITALGTISAFLYNLSANAIGGLEVTLSED